MSERAGMSETMSSAGRLTLMVLRQHAYDGLGSIGTHTAAVLVDLIDSQAAEIEQLRVLLKAAQDDADLIMWHLSRHAMGCGVKDFGDVEKSHAVVVAGRVTPP